MDAHQSHDHSGDEKIETQIIRNLPFPLAPWFTKEHIEETLDNVPNDGDIIVASYPKTGTTWLQYIVLQIVSGGKLYPSMDEATFKVVPFMEATGRAAVDALENRPRMYKHHCPYNMVQKNSKSKVLYIYRHPEDTLVSYYFFVRELWKHANLELDQHFENFLSGDLGYGRYFEHVLSYYACRKDDNLMMISYEKLLLNRKECLLEIARFLGEDYYKKLSSDVVLMDGIIERTNFDYMKKHIPVPHAVLKDTNDGRANVNFFRKGQAGDGKNKLSLEQRSRLRELALSLMKETDILKEWYE